jgi:hypothetical protein
VRVNLIAPPAGFASLVNLTVQRKSPPVLTKMNASNWLTESKVVLGVA